MKRRHRSPHFARRIEAAPKGVGDVDRTRRFKHGYDRHRGGIDVGADDVLDALPARQALRAGNREFGVKLIVDRHDLNLVAVVTDLDAAFLVVHLGGSLGRILVDQPPRGSGAAHRAKHAYLEHFLFCRDRARQQGGCE